MDRYCRNGSDGSGLSGGSGTLGAAAVFVVAVVVVADGGKTFAAGVFPVGVVFP